MHRKFTASHIFTGSSFLPEGNVLITNQEGVIEAIVPAANAGDDIAFYDGIICPGFINAHCHLELSHLKSAIPEHTGLVDFVYRIITQRQAGTEAILQAVKDAEAEMLQAGIVAVGDICNTLDSVQQKKEGRLYYHNFIEVTGFVPATAGKRFETALQNLRSFNEELRGTGSNSSISPHAPYSVSKELFACINNHPGNSLVSIHNQETPEETAFFESGTGDFLKLYELLGIDISFYKPSGKSSLQSFLPFFNQQQSLVLVHDVTTTADDIRLTQEAVAANLLSSVHYCLCPNANKYITNSLPDVNMLVNNHCNIILGTDSLASNHQLSILEEMKTLQGHFPSLKTEQLLQWSTLNGARALQMDDVLGSFDKGRQPGIVLISGADNNMLTKNASAKRLL